MSDRRSTEGTAAKAAARLFVVLLSSVAVVLGAYGVYLLGKEETAPIVGRWLLTGAAGLLLLVFLLMRARRQKRE